MNESIPIFILIFAILALGASDELGGECPKATKGQLIIGIALSSASLLCAGIVPYACQDLKNPDNDYSIQGQSLGKAAIVVYAVSSVALGIAGSVNLAKYFRGRNCRNRTELLVHINSVTMVYRF